MGNKTFIGILALGLFSALWCHYLSNFTGEPETSRPKLHCSIYPVNDGYGYMILNGDQPLIKQDFIPVVAGKKTFPSAKDARLVADLVMDKMRKGASPVLVLQELHDLNIPILEK